MGKLSSWGNFPKIEGSLFFTREYDSLKSYVVNSQKGFIPRGNGRSYGDSALSPNVVSMLGFNRIIDFDVENGVITAESGVLLSELLEVIVPRGYFLPVTPGTKFITLGGAVASNVHGKNHHKEGSLASFTLAMGIMTSDGTVQVCQPDQNQELFRQTLGGMGLTGVILWVSIRLRKIETAYISQVNHKAKNLAELLTLFETSQDSTYSVAWIDCQKTGNAMGRSILMLGEHAGIDELKTSFQLQKPLKVHSNKHLSVPFNFPSGVLNQWTVSLFNHLYYTKEFQNTRNFISHYEPFFYPLDKILHWNRIYGKKGFLQYQFVLPFESGEKGMVKILKEIATSGHASFLAVLKTFGESSVPESDLSFPEKGYTLALDFPISKGIFELLEKLDCLVLEYGGRVYLTKDARMSAETFGKMYPNGFSLSSKFASLQSNRLKI